MLKKLFPFSGFSLKRSKNDFALALSRGVILLILIVLAIIHVFVLNAPLMHTERWTCCLNENPTTSALGTNFEGLVQAVSAGTWVGINAEHREHFATSCQA